MSRSRTLSGCRSGARTEKRERQKWPIGSLGHLVVRIRARAVVNSHKDCFRCDHWRATDRVISRYGRRTSERFPCRFPINKRQSTWHKRTHAIIASTNQGTHYRAAVSKVLCRLANRICRTHSPSATSSCHADFGSRAETE